MWCHTELTRIHKAQRKTEIGGTAAEKASSANMAMLMLMFSVCRRFSTVCPSGFLDNAATQDTDLATLLTKAYLSDESVTYRLTTSQAQTVITRLGTDSESQQSFHHVAGAMQCRAASFRRCIPNEQSCSLCSASSCQQTGTQSFTCPHFQ